LTVEVYVLEKKCK